MPAKPAKPTLSQEGVKAQYKFQCEGHRAGQPCPWQPKAPGDFCSQNECTYKWFFTSKGCVQHKTKKQQWWCPMHAAEYSIWDNEEMLAKVITQCCSVCKYYGMLKFMRNSVDPEALKVRTMAICKSWGDYSWPTEPPRQIVWQTTKVQGGTPTRPAWTAPWATPPGLEDPSAASSNDLTVVTQTLQTPDVKELPATKPDKELPATKPNKELPATYSKVTEDKLKHLVHSSGVNTLPPSQKFNDVPTPDVMPTVDTESAPDSVDTEAKFAILDSAKPGEFTT